jgi:hypothetical protein
MRGSYRFVAALLLALFSFFALPINAFAADIPLLTWERGKEQNIVMGGKTGAAKWDLYLVGEGRKSLKFKSSLANSKGFLVYSLNIPADLPTGAYSVQATAPGENSSVVAGVRIAERTIYAVTEIPTDLRLLLILYVILASSFSVIRAKKYANLSFTRDQHLFGSDPFEDDYVEDKDDRKKSKVKEIIQPLYTFRRRRLSALEISFMKFVAMKDGEPIHKLSPNIWASLPFIGLGIGLFTGLKIQGNTVIPNIPLWILITCAVIGALDAASGIAIAIGLASVQIVFGDLSSIRSMLILFSFTLAWYLPSLLSSMYLLTLPRDFEYIQKRISNRYRIILINVIASLLGSIAVLISAILTDSLVINRQSSSISRLPLAGIVFLVLLIKNGLEVWIERSRKNKSLEVHTKEESLYLARVVSPGFAFLFAIAIFGLIFVWTQSWGQSGLGTLLVVLPFILLFTVFPEFAIKAIPPWRRNLVAEVAVVALLTTGIFFGIQFLPLGVVAKSKTFILLGVIPVLLHGIYSVLLASKEHASQELAESKVGGEA